MTARAGARAKDRQDQPDPGHFERFCREIAPEILTDVCHVDEKLAAHVGKDILARAESYAALDDTARDVLIAPFAEEVAGYKPAGSSRQLKGAVAVYVDYADPPVMPTGSLERVHRRDFRPRLSA